MDRHFVEPWIQDAQLTCGGLGHSPIPSEIQDIGRNNTATRACSCGSRKSDVTDILNFQKMGQKGAGRGWSGAE